MLTQAHILQSCGDNAAAEACFHKTLALDPNAGDAHNNLAIFYMMEKGDIEKAYYHSKCSYALDEEETCGILLLTWLTKLGNTQETISAAALVLSRSKRRIAIGPYDFDAIHLIAYASFLLGDIEEAKHWTFIASAYQSDDETFIYNIACLHSRLGSADASLLMLERALAAGGPATNIDYIRSVDPDLAQVRKDPRFDPLIARYAAQIEGA